MSRTLAGHLEDLDLDEVVRVIALSRRSGVLAVESSEESGELLFLFGRIVSARASGSAETVAEVLLKAGILDATDLAAAHDGTRTLDDVLRAAAARRPDDPGLIARADAVLCEHLKVLVLKVLLLKTGRFSFRITDDEAPPDRYPRDTRFTVADGVDAEELAREARRRRLGRRRDPLAPLAHGGRRRRCDEAGAVDVILVDDDERFRERAERHARAAGLELKALPHARAALEALPRLAETSPQPVLVADLVMPRASGRGILGGLEVLRKASELGCAGRVFLALEEPHEDAEARAQELGAAGVVRKPIENGAPASFVEFLNPVLERLGRPKLQGDAIDLVDQLRAELADFERDWRAEEGGRRDDAQKSLEVLKSLLGELNDPSFEEEIPLLVLRFASAFFSRGALFHVNEKAGAIVGLGGFGIGGDDAGRTLHSVRLPLDADTVFTRCLRERCGVRQPFYESEWNARLMNALGGPRPREVYTAPLRSPRGTEAVLYADNALDGRAFPDIALLEIFLQQAGAALERWSLKRQVEELRQKSEGV